MSESPNNDGESPSSRSSSKYDTEHSSLFIGTPFIYIARETQTRRSKRPHYGESPDGSESPQIGQDEKYQTSHIYLDKIPSSEYDVGENLGGESCFSCQEKY